MPKRVVISIHGIRTRGVWQKDLVPPLARADFIPYALDYGKYRAVSLAIGCAREKQIAWLLQQYNRIVQESGDERPSIIAHSFGTYQVAELLDRNPNVKFDKVIFAASIVRPDFDWGRLLAEGQLNFIENDYGGRDFWPRAAARIVSSMGPSGTVGFSNRSARLNQRSFPRYRHSSYFHYVHFRDNWIPTLLLDMGTIVEILQLVVTNTAARLKLAPEMVRANVFMPDRTAGDRLWIMPGLHVNMFDEKELKITLPTNLGPAAIPGAPTAFLTRKPVTTIYDPASVPRDVLRPHHDLQWIVSIPILVNEAVSGVLNVDGLEPVELNKLDPVAEMLVPYAQKIGPLLVARSGA